MESLIVHRSMIFLALTAATFGRPTSGPRDAEEIKRARMEVEMMRDIRPCYARLLEVKTDILQYGDINGDPHYIPECNKGGFEWRPSQCDHHDEGACFCVHENNGEILAHTRTMQVNRESLGCGVEDHVGHECFHMKDEFDHMTEEYGLTGHSPLPYYPECTPTGKFVAIQRDGSSRFFCVDVETGDVIPDTVTNAGDMPPLTEFICKAYDKVWQEYKKWNSSHDTETHESENPIDESSCSEGFTFTECGCPLVCTYKTTFATLKEGCVCKPACVCPKGMLELDGSCVSLEECNIEKPASETPQVDKLEDLTNGDYTRWKEFKESNPNAVLKSYSTMGMEEPMEFAGEPILYDENPNANFLLESPSREESFEEQSSEIKYQEADPLLLQKDESSVLKKGGSGKKMEEEEDEVREKDPEQDISPVLSENFFTKDKNFPIFRQVFVEGQSYPDVVEEFHNFVEFENFEENYHEQNHEWEVFFEIERPDKRQDLLEIFPEESFPSTRERQEPLKYFTNFESENQVLNAAGFPQEEEDSWWGVFYPSVENEFDFSEKDEEESNEYPPDKFENKQFGWDKKEPNGFSEEEDENILIPFEEEMSNQNIKNQLFTEKVLKAKPIKVTVAERIPSLKEYLAG